MRPLALFLLGAIVGGVAGGFVAGIRSGPEGGLVPGASIAPGTLAPAARAAGAPAASTGEVVADVAAQLSASVVTVVNKLASGQPQSSGSGFLVDAQRGYILTNNHVVSNVRGTGVGASFDVIFPDSRKVSAKLVGRDPDTDVAVLEVGAQNVRALALGNSDDAPIGGTVIAIGSALGEFRNSVTAGVLSGKGRRLQSENDPNIFLEDLIQTDAAISPGNSGGPLILASTRQVIGMNTLVIRAAGSEGLGFAVSSNTVRQIADEIIKNGQVVRGRIGIAYQLLTTRNAQLLGLPSGASGAQVSEVVPGSAAAAAGIRQGDVITKVNDQQIDEEHPLATIMLKYRPGDKVRLTLLRGGTEQSVEITLGRP
jgi:2-alkenal reductase